MWWLVAWLMWKHGRSLAVCIVRVRRHFIMRSAILARMKRVCDVKKVG